MTTAKKRPKKTKSQPRTAQQQPQQRNIPWIGIAFGVVAVALVGAIVFSGDQAIGSEFGEVTIEGDPLVPFVSGVADPAIGLPAPEVAGVDFDGNTVEIVNDGTPKAVVFLAHWCPHCQAEVPRVQAWLDATGGVEGVEFVSVTTSMNSAQANWPPSEWLDREGWTTPVIRDNSGSDVLGTFGGSAFPFYTFIDADGNIAGRISGELDVATLEGFMREIAP